jgi:hypothetical protein
VCVIEHHSHFSRILNNNNTQHNTKTQKKNGIENRIWHDSSTNNITTLKREIDLYHDFAGSRNKMQNYLFIWNNDS